MIKEGANLGRDTMSGKLKWIIMRKYTKMPKQSVLSKRNKEILEKIEKYIRKFG